MGRPGLHVGRTRPETRLTSLRRIGIFGHVGNQNLGDEAIIAAVLQAVRERIPDAQISAFTIRPEDSKARHGIPAFPIRPGVAPPNAASGRSGSTLPGTDQAKASRPLHAAIRRVPGLHRVLSGARDAVRWFHDALREVAFWATRYRQMRGIDLLVIAGSNQLSDYVGGPWGFPYTIYAWSLAARLAGTRVAFLSVGAGPIRSRLSRHLIRTALGWAAYRSYRDIGSRDTIKALGVREPYRVAPDLAHGLRFEVPRDAARPPAGRRTVVVNPLPYFDPRFWAESNRDTYDAYVHLLADVAAKLLDRGDRIQFVPTQLRADPPVIVDVMGALGRRARDPEPSERMDPPVATFEELVALLAGADVVIASRFHGVVLAQMLGKPTIGLAYRPSTTDLLVDVGQGAYAIDIAQLTLAGLMERLDALEADHGAAERIEARMRAYREALAAQYDLVLGTAEGDAGRERSAPVA